MHISLLEIVFDKDFKNLQSLHGNSQIRPLATKKNYWILIRS